MSPVSPPLPEADDDDDEEEEEEVVVDEEQEEVLDEEAQLMASMGLPVAFVCSSDKRRGVSGPFCVLCCLSPLLRGRTKRKGGALPAAEALCLLM